MSWYSIANEEVNLTIQKVMKENHGDLHAEGVTITALIARSEDGPALKVGGREVSVVEPSKLQSGGVSQVYEAGVGHVNATVGVDG